MKREFSAGGIVFNRKGQVLLIHNAALRDPSKSYWGFPKGHINQGEKSDQAAMREVKEETGVDTKIIQKIGEYKYIFTAQNDKVFKLVIFYLMKAVTDEITIQQEELLDAKWVDVAEALDKLSFKNDKKLLEEAVEIDQD